MRSIIALLRVAILTAFALARATKSWGAECTPSLPFKEGWLGGDVAYSIPLSPQHSVWLFGDTFIGDSTRSDSSMVANSIAISICGNAEFNIHYYLAPLKAGASRAFFVSPTSAYRYWPMDGFVHDGRLYLSLYSRQ